jgi:hypothetical protein
MDEEVWAADDQSGRFLGLIVHEHGIQIDPKKIESIGKIGKPVCKKDVQKLLGEINYLCCFISNLVGRVESLLPLVQLKHEKEFTWGGGVEQREAFKKIKEYLMSPPVLRASKAGNPFKMYIAMQDGLFKLFYYKKMIAWSFWWHMLVDVYLMLKHSMFSWENFAYLYTMLAPSLGITPFLVLA